MPDFQSYSIVQIAKKPIDPCDFLGKYHDVEGYVAIDINESHAGWQLGMATNIAIKPAEVRELVDGVIVY